MFHRKLHAGRYVVGERSKGLPDSHSQAVYVTKRKFNGGGAFAMKVGTPQCLERYCSVG